MSNPLNHPRVDDINRLAQLLIDTWMRVDPTSGVAKYPVSYIANFADMARAIIDDPNIDFSFKVTTEDK